MKRIENVDKDKENIQDDRCFLVQHVSKLKGFVEQNLGEHLISYIVKIIEKVINYIKQVVFIKIVVFKKNVDLKVVTKTAILFSTSIFYNFDYIFMDLLNYAGFRYSH